MPSDPITGVYNDAYIAQLYDEFRRDPASIDESWRQYFRFAESLGGAPPLPPAAPSGESAPAAADPTFLRKVAGAAALIDAIRYFGHLAVPLDPLGSP
ncbi:MAG TPA: hypothetical protein VFX50_17130, partial [Gemmatimonadales bacterium]|nr:hypothetical protein [Gemmatimonadales bacterium]